MASPPAHDASSTSTGDVASTTPIVPPQFHSHPVDVKHPLPAPGDEMEMEMKKTSEGISVSAPRKLGITVLLASGQRHSFVMDKAYLERHAIKESSGKEELIADPFDLSVWQLKECIWKDWKEEWDQRPASALFIKLIQFGAYLDDRNLLKDCRLSSEAPNVIHMAIRPAEAGDDDATQRSTKGAFGRSDRDGGGRTPTCRCTLM